MTFVIVSIAFYIVFLLVSMFIVFRSSGVLETILKMRDARVTALDDSVQANRNKILDLVEAVAGMAAELRAANSSLSNRMVSLESRYGRASKAEEKEALKKQFFEAVNQTTKP